jgi:hypothetical protein
MQHAKGQRTYKHAAAELLGDGVLRGLEEAPLEAVKSTEIITEV